MEITKELKKKLLGADSQEEVKALLGDEVTEEDVTKVWKEIEAHKAAPELEKVDDDELEAISGGADRDYLKDGCLSTTDNDWCWVSDNCLKNWTTYSNFEPCPKGGDHAWQKIVLINWELNSQRVFFECKKCHKRTEVEWDGKMGT